MESVGYFAASFMGVDRSTKDDDKGRGKIKSSWFQELYERSNFSFLGLYLTHPRLNKTQLGATPIRPHYTGASIKRSAHWVDSWPALSKQGWGGCWFYVGYSPGWNEDVHPPERGTSDKGKWPIKNARKAGILHGRHVKVAIKDLLAKYDSDNTGAIVFVDNEGGPEGQLNNKPDYVSYYNAMFEEMRHPGPDGSQPVRPGLYGPDNDARPNLSEMLDANPDLFVWQIDSRVKEEDQVRKDRTGRNIMRAIPQEDEKEGRIWLDPKRFEIHAQKTTLVESRNTIVSIPVGIQGILNYEDVQPSKDNPNPRSDIWPPMPNTPNMSEGFVRVNGWDFDMSFVRDPRYAEASPRLRCHGASIARGVYNKLDCRMEVTLSHSKSSPEIEGSPVEPDAPLLFLEESELITLDTTGAFISSRTSPASKVWSAFSTLMAQKLSFAPRRARAMAAMKLSDGSSHLFYIAHDLTIQALIRRSGNTKWEGPLTIAKPEHNPLFVHAFSNLACTVGAGSPRSIQLASVSTEGCLQLFRYIPGTSESRLPLVDIFPSENKDIGIPDSTHTLLLQGTAILALTPHPSTNLVFAVSRSLRLVMFGKTSDDARWSSIQQLGRVGPDKVSGKVFAHTRLAANIVNPTVVQVACMSYIGDPTIYVVQFSAKTKAWDLAPVPIAISRDQNPISFPGKLVDKDESEPPNRRKMNLRPGEKDASDWSINPYGDICFGLDPSGTDKIVLMCAGTDYHTASFRLDNAVGVMYRRYGMANEDWYLRG